MIRAAAIADSGGIEVAGLQIPDAGGLFMTALVVHVLAGGVCVVAGALAAFAKKRPGRHPRTGTVYISGLLVLVVSAVVLALIRWPNDVELVWIACLAGIFGTIGWWTRRRQPHGWVRWHGIAMAGSYVSLLTGFYVDNGPQLPVWDRLPAVAYWVLPALVGVPLTWSALTRNGAVSWPPWRRRNVVPRRRPG